jgi:hypothetical protein
MIESFSTGECLTSQQYGITSTSWFVPVTQGRREHQGRRELVPWDPVLATTQAVRGFVCSSGPGLAVIDDAADWATFSNSSEADRLAGQVPSAELCQQFAVDRYEEQLKQFIVEAARDSEPRCSLVGCSLSSEPSKLQFASDGPFCANCSTICTGSHAELADKGHTQKETGFTEGCVS